MCIVRRKLIKKKKGTWVDQRAVEGIMKKKKKKTNDVISGRLRLRFISTKLRGQKGHRKSSKKKTKTQESKKKKYLHEFKKRRMMSISKKTQARPRKHPSRRRGDDDETQLRRKKSASIKACSRNVRRVPVPPEAPWRPAAARSETNVGGRGAHAAAGKPRLC